MFLSELYEGRAVRRAVEPVVFEEQYDVIISGLGTAGSMAAIMAAENGLRVLGIEALGSVGGTTTNGGIQNHYFGCPGGRYEAIDRVVTEHHTAHTYNRLESCKIVLEEQILAAGAAIRYESSIIGIYLQEETVVGVRAITPDGLCDIGCRVLMDCTGDANTAAMAGCRSEFGRDTDGLPQPYSAVSLKRIPTGVRYTNFDFGRVDQRDDRAFSEAMIFSRGYEMTEERSTGRFMIHLPMLGLREGRRIVPQETVRVTDIFAGRFTETPMFYSYADLDKHGWDIAFDSTALCDWAIGANLGAYNITVPVPYLAIVPETVDGLLVPCRGLGVDRDISSCVRMVLDMKKVAEVAADMAMLALRHGCRLREVPYGELQVLLRSSGCLDDAYDRGYRADGLRDGEGNLLPARAITFAAQPQELVEKLAGITPGEAIWAAKRMEGRANGLLRSLLGSSDENTRRHAAFALAITGDTTGLALLRQMMAERDGVMLKDCRKHNQQRGCMAIYFLGRLADRESTDTLIEILTDPHEIDRPAYHCEFAMGTRYRVHNFNNEYFQFFTGAVAALIRIGETHPDLRPKIAAAFAAALEDGSYYDRITTRPKLSSEGGMVLNVHRVAREAAERWQV